MKRVAAGTVLLLFSLWGAFRLFCPPLRALEFGQMVHDRHNRLLRLTLSTDSRYRLPASLKTLSPKLVDATLAYEDEYFFWHPGINPVSLWKAFSARYVTGEGRRGGSTLTMQVARLRFGLNTRTLQGKWTQIVRAVQLECAYSKAEILEAYFELAPYGGNIEGVEAASQIYFHKPASELSWPEAMALSLIPQNPNKRAPRGSSEPEPLHAARERLSGLLQKKKGLAHDILALESPLAFYSPRQLPFEAPHAVAQALKNLPKEKAEVQLTLDLELQHLLERQVQAHVDRLSSMNLSNAVAMLVDTETLEVRAHVGSVDFFNASIAGQVDGVSALRSPGSALKPFVYARALDEGLIHPRTLLKDVPMRFGSYNPENFDSEYLGPLTATEALVRSRNVPAVELNTKLKVGLYEVLSRIGVRKLAGASHYGAGIVLGSVEVSMEDLASLYAALARGGEWAPIRRQLPAREGKPLLLFSKEAAALTLEMLTSAPTASDAWLNSRDRLPVAWKTGTSHAFRDAWTAGVSGNWVLVVWVGNFDGSSNPALVGRTAASPLFFGILEALRSYTQQAPRVFREKNNVVETHVCAVSGKMAGPHCSKSAKARVIAGVSPIAKCDVHRVFHVNVENGLRECSPKPGKTQDVVFEVWPSDVLWLFEKAGMPRRALPKASESCLNDEFQAPTILFPQPSMVLTLRRGHLSEGQVQLLANADGSVRQLTWFADNELIGQVAPGKTLEWAPEEGRYELRVVDDQGRVAKVSTEVSWLESP